MNAPSDELAGLLSSQKNGVVQFHLNHTHRHRFTPLTDILESIMVIFFISIISDYWCNNYSLFMLDISFDIAVLPRIFWNRKIDYEEF